MRSDFVNSDSFKVLTNCMEYENGLALRVSIETGLRIGDVLKIKRKDIDGNKITFTAEKTGKRGTKEISSRLARELGRFFRAPDEYIFQGKGKSGHRTRQAVYVDLKKACKRLGIEGQISPHSARKSYAVKVFHDKGLNVVQRELQHRNVSDTFLYCLSDMFGPKKEKEDEASPVATSCPLFSSEKIEELAERLADVLADKIADRVVDAVESNFLPWITGNY